MAASSLLLGEDTLLPVKVSMTTTDGTFATVNNANVVDNRNGGDGDDDNDEVVVVDDVGKTANPVPLQKWVDVSLISLSLLL